MKCYGKVQQAKRTSKLFVLHSLILAFFKAGVEARGEAADAIYERLGLPLPDGFEVPEWVLELFVSIRKSQTENELVRLATASKDYAEKIRGQIESAKEQARPLRAILSNLLECNPLSMVINSLHQKSLETMKVLTSGTEDQKRDLYLSRDILGSSISLGIFSMRSSRSRILSQARLTKDLMNS